MLLVVYSNSLLARLVRAYLFIALLLSVISPSLNARASHNRQPLNISIDIELSEDSMIAGRYQTQAATANTVHIYIPRMVDVTDPLTEGS